MRESETRRHKSTLIYSGAAVIVLGIWGAIKLFALNQVDPAGMQEYLAYYGSAASAVVMIAVELLIRLYIGLSAISEGKGKKKGRAYLVVGGVYLVLDFAVYVVLAVALFEPGIIGAVVASFIIDATSCIAMVLVIVASCKLRKLEKAGCAVGLPKAGEAAEAQM